MANIQSHLITDRMSQVVEVAYQNIIELLEKPDVSLDDVRDHVFSVIEETRVSLEELRVANEEIYQQQEELEAAQHLLEYERNHYRDLFNAAPVGYIVTDCDGLILEANCSASDMLGVPLDRLAGKPLTVYIPLNHRPAFRQHLSDVVHSQTMQTWETVYLPREGSERDIKLTAVPVETRTARDADSLRWLLVDITDQKEAEAIKLEHFFRETFEQSPVGIGHLGFDGRWLRVNQALCGMLGYTRDELLGLRVRDVAYAEDVIRFNDAHKQILDGVLPIVGLELRCLSKQGDIVWVRLGISSVSHAHGHHAYSIAIISDITETKRVAAAERKQRVLAEALRDTAITLTSTLDFEEVLDQIMLIMGSIFAQKAAAIMLIENNEFHIVRAWHEAEPVTLQLERAIADLTIPAVPEGIIRRMMDTFKPVIINDWNNHADWSHIAQIGAIRSLIAVPIIALDKMIGSMLLYSPQPDTFSLQESEILQTFAAHAAVAIQNARSHQQALQLAAHEERQRLARDLHDSVTQSLFSASIISESLVRRQKQSTDPIAEQMQELHLLTRGALAEMRTLLIELRPEFLLKSPLSTQIRQLVDAVRSRKRMNIEFNNSGGGTLPGEIQIAFYRIAQEVFNNIVKHSGASNTTVTLTSNSDFALLDIVDDGIGFDVEAVPAGIGQLTMRERAEAIGASFMIESKRGHGTRVFLKWPGRSEEPEDVASRN